MVTAGYSKHIFDHWNVIAIHLENRVSGRACLIQDLPKVDLKWEMASGSSSFSKTARIDYPPQLKCLCLVSTRPTCNQSTDFWNASVRPTLNWSANFSHQLSHVETLHLFCKKINWVANEFEFIWKGYLWIIIMYLIIPIFLSYQLSIGYNSNKKVSSPTVNLLFFKELIDKETVPQVWVPPPLLEEKG